MPHKALSLERVQASTEAFLPSFPSSVYGRKSMEEEEKEEADRQYICQQRRIHLASLGKVATNK